MIVNNNYTVATGTVCDNATQQYSIAQTPEVMELLSKGLYKDPFMAVVREPYSNARDAHVIAGNTATPVQITVPTALEPNFSIKDFGTGLSEEDVMSLFTTYGMSTKRNSNAVIGCLGVGSKAPFALVDEFTVISRYEGVATMYHCYKSKGLMQITKIHSHPTDEHSGMEIIIAGLDRGKIEAACRQFFQYVEPSHFNINIHVPYVLSRRTINCDDYTALKMENYTRTVLIKMGEVVYKFCDVYWKFLLKPRVGTSFAFDSNQPPTVTETAVQVHRDWRYHVLEVPIGTFTTTASRESIDTSDVNLQKFAEIQQLICTTAEKKVLDANLKTAISICRFDNKIAFLPKDFEIVHEIKKLYKYDTETDRAYYTIKTVKSTRCTKPVKTLKECRYYDTNNTMVYNCNIGEVDLRLVAKYFEDTARDVKLVYYKDYLKSRQPTVNVGNSKRKLRIVKYADILYTYKDHNRDYRKPKQGKALLTDDTVFNVTSFSTDRCNNGVYKCRKEGAKNYGSFATPTPYITTVGSVIDEKDYHLLNTLAEMYRVSVVPSCTCVTMNKKELQKYGVPAKFVTLEKYISDMNACFTKTKAEYERKNAKRIARSLLNSRIDSALSKQLAEIFGVRCRAYTSFSFPRNYIQIEALVEDVNRIISAVDSICSRMPREFEADLRQTINKLLKEKYSSKIEQYRKNGWKDF